MRINNRTYAKNLYKGKTAIALQYDGISAPRVTAKGSQELAEKILSVAQEHQVPIYEDEILTGALAHLELGDEIPELLYMAIAEVLTFVWELDKKSQISNQSPEQISSQKHNQP